MRYFKKEIITNRVTLKNGRQLTFAHVVDNTGVVVIDEKTEPDCAAEMASMIRRFGISEITEAQFEEFKKKQPSNRRVVTSPGPRLFEQGRDPFKGNQRITAVVPAPTTRVLSPSDLPPAPPQGKPVSIAQVLANAKSAEATNPAAPAAASATPSAKPPKGEFKPRTGTTKKAAKATPSE